MVARAVDVRSRFRTTVGGAGPALHPVAAEPPAGRPARCGRLGPRRTAPGLRGRGDRHQPGLGLTRRGARPAGAARRGPHHVRDPHPVLRPGPRDHHPGADRAGCPGGPGLPVHRRHRGDQPVLRGRPRPADARPGTRRSRWAAAPSGRTSCTSRPARGRRCRPTRTSAPGDARWTSRPWRPGRTASPAHLEPVPGEHRGRVHRSGVPLRRQADHPRRPRGPLLREAAGTADGRRRLLHQPRRWPTRTTWTCCWSRSPPRGCSFIITVPGGDDVMLGYQSASFHDALAVRELLDLRPAPEFEEWLAGLGLLVGRRRGPPAGRTRRCSGLGS